MKEIYKLILGGVWVVVLTIVSVFINEYFTQAYGNPLIIFIWAFAWLAGYHLSTWGGWASDFNKRRKNMFRCPFSICDFEAKSLLEIHFHLAQEHGLNKEGLKDK